MFTFERERDRETEFEQRRGRETEGDPKSAAGSRL